MVPTVYNLAWLLWFLGLQGLQVVVLPGWLLPEDSRWGWLLLLPLVFTNAWWAFLHEAIHNHLFATPRWDRGLGRIHAILYGAAFDLLRQGHLLHHGYSRTPRESTEVYGLDKASIRPHRGAYYLRLLGGLYWLEVGGSLLLFLPRPLLKRFIRHHAAPQNLLGALFRRLMKPGSLAAARTDSLAMVSLYTLVLFAYGPHAWMLLLALIGRALLISFMDNAYHYGTPLGNPRQAQNLKLPAWQSLLLLHFNLHGVHHQHPALPWHRLPTSQPGEAPLEPFWPAYFRQLQGPIPATDLPPPSLR